jgi:hypothetical protein
MDLDAWTTITSREWDTWDFQKLADGQVKPVPLIPTPIKFVADLFARGATFIGLPGCPESTAEVPTPLENPGRPPAETEPQDSVISGIDVKMTPTETENVSVVKVAFSGRDADWNDRRPFVLSAVAFSASAGPPPLPVWSPGTPGRLIVSLPQAEDLEVKLSSYLAPADLPLMQQHRWATGLTMRVVNGRIVRTPISDTIDKLAEMGSHWLLSPPVSLRMTHAVRRPLIAPTWHAPKATKQVPGQTWAVVEDVMPISGKSTAKVEVFAQWSEMVDDLPRPGPETRGVFHERAFEVPVETYQTDVLSQPVSPVRGEVSAAATDAPSPDARSHYFGDTKHRLVTYSATATSRFADYFIQRDESGNPIAPIPEVTREGGTAVQLHIPSSARPNAPKVLYAVPLFGWERPSSTESRRLGGGIRVYMERPWYSSGDDERLAVVVWTPLTDAERTARADKVKPYITEWGVDPIWAGEALPTDEIALTSFLGARETVTDLMLDESSRDHVGAAVYDVYYDQTRQLWYADIRMDTGASYFPFVRLALARYQGYGMRTFAGPLEARFVEHDLRLSSVVRADFAQLTPGRTASVAYSPDRTEATLAVTGPTYAKGGSDRHYAFQPDFVGALARVFVRIESRPTSAGEFAWFPEGDEMELERLNPSTAATATWQRVIPTVTKQAGREYRILIKEYEVFRKGGPDITETIGSNDAHIDAPFNLTDYQEQRLVYADALPLE